MKFIFDLQSIEYDEIVFDYIEYIFKRINKEQEWFPVSGSVESIMFKGRVPDPNNPGKTVLQKKLVPVGEVMKVRGGDFIFQTNGDFIWTFPQGSQLKPKKLDVFINQVGSEENLEKAYGKPIGDIKNNYLIKLLLSHVRHLFQSL